ncbi:MAG: cytochrome P450 [Anaerolineae bacterium]|nr:cytochrome P450 [Anaerolineae bacterium]
MPMSLDALLTSADFFSDPYPAYHRLRAEAPVYWSEAWGGWVLTRYSDVVAVFKDPRLYSSAGRVTYLLEQLPDDVRRAAAPLEAHYEVGLAHSDPPTHTRLRAILNRAFAARRVEALRPRIQQVVDELLEAVEARGDGQMDIIADLAYPLPATVIAEMIGAPTEDRDKFRDWAIGINELFSHAGRVTVEGVQRAQTSLLEMREYIRALVEDHRARPRDSLLGLLVVAGDQSETLTEAELVATCVTLFVAGHETTTNLIGLGMLALLQHPDALAELRARPDLAESAVEELLRYDTSVQRGWRIARADVDWDGHRIRQGQMVLPMLGAANRDPAQFPDPDRLDLGRRDNRHVGFGFGIHFCLGAPLARLEAPLALNALLARFPRLALTGAPLQWRQDVALRGLLALPVTY